MYSSWSVAVLLCQVLLALQICIAMAEPGATPPHHNNSHHGANAAVQHSHHHHHIHQGPADPDTSPQDAAVNPLHNTSSPEFRKLAEETYRKIMPCIQSTWMYEGKPPVKFEFPHDAEHHFEYIKNRTVDYRKVVVHEYAGYSGPWIENIFIEKFLNKPLHHFRGLIPIYIQWIDSQILRGRHFDYIFAELNEILRPNVLYLAISQGDVGLGKIGMHHPNILALSAGGFGHVPLPLVKGLLEWEQQPGQFDQDIGFFGTSRQATRPQMFDVIRNAARENGLTFKEGRGDSWKTDMAKTKYNLAPRGYGRSSFRFAESIQIGRIPAFLYNDVPWIPYQGTNVSVETYGFSAGLTASMNNLTELVQAFKNMSPEEYKLKLQKLHHARHYFTYEGVVEQIEQLLQDPFGPNGGYLRCTKHPRNERCCD